MAKKKKKRNRNPQLAVKYKEGYEEGFSKGMRVGKMQFVAHIEHKFNSLDQIDGVGPKTLKKIIDHFGVDFVKLRK